MKINIAHIVIALALASCNRPDPKAAPVNTPQADATVTGIILSTPPAGAIDVHSAIGHAMPGDRITLKGKLLGAEKIFVENRAAFVIGDPGMLTVCSDKPGDTCTTPWDACCDASEIKAAAMATIQIVDNTGAVLRGNLKGVGGLKELSTVVVTGKVAPGSGKNALVVNATGIFVEPVAK